MMAENKLLSEEEFPQRNQVLGSAKTDEDQRRHKMLDDCEHQEIKRGGNKPNLGSPKIGKMVLNRETRGKQLEINADLKKQQVSEQYDVIRKALESDERATLESIEQEKRVTGSKLNKSIKEWSQYLTQAQTSLKKAEKDMEENRAGHISQDISIEHSCHKKIDDQDIFMNELRFQKLLKLLQNMNSDLKAQLQRKSYLLDASSITFDENTSHKNLMVSKDLTSVYLTNEAHTREENPQQFDKVCCVLGTTSVFSGRHYWEFDVKCCLQWSLGIAYGSIERKGTQKSVKLGKNKQSWCLELRNNQLSAWHNDRYIICVKRQPLLNKVGIFVDFEMAQLIFFNATTMKVIQEFSPATASVFDTVHHSFTQPIYPALRFFPLNSSTLKVDHIDICKHSV
uniref:Zinc-binding protein A33-like n=1 Tax=Erpetoichthys calabaricus TaxID=27687 RepID=A0A8C4X4C2_ERPCA